MSSIVSHFYNCFSVGTIIIYSLIHLYCRSIISVSS
nr:MAG TPA: hypothetical protein [Bacteriophage sp.]DAW98700.1 MAG TPA: hypothetical protein [Caudoviricetes sp.]DAX15159.1 MAG TPA: hypothetical protein [Bacteriophage sp.]